MYTFLLFFACGNSFHIQLFTITNIWMTVYIARNVIVKLYMRNITLSERDITKNYDNDTRHE